MTREEKMNKRREAGKTYEYKTNPYPEGSAEYNDERWRRAQKNVSKKLPLAQWTSLMKKLDNELEKQKADAKDKR